MCACTWCPVHIGYLSDSVKSICTAYCCHICWLQGQIVFSSPWPSWWFTSGGSALNASATLDHRTWLMHHTRLNCIELEHELCLNFWLLWQWNYKRQHDFHYSEEPGTTHVHTHIASPPTSKLIREPKENSYRHGKNWGLLHHHAALANFMIFKNHWFSCIYWLIYLFYSIWFPFFIINGW